MSSSSNTKKVIFTIGGEQEQLVMTRTGVTAESLLKVLQFLRDRSPDPEIGSGARLMITLISETLRSSVRQLGISKITVSFKWLVELSLRVKGLTSGGNNKSVWFIVAFVNEIVPAKKEEVIQ